MIIQCEKCKTRFRLDDSKISEAGVRVRCSRCTHTFVVRRDVSEEEQDFDSILHGLGDSPNGSAEAAERADVPAAHGSSERPESSSPEPEENEPPAGTEEPCSTETEDSGRGGGIPEKAFADLLEKGEGLPHFQTGGDAAEEAEDAVIATEPGSDIQPFADEAPAGDDVHAVEAEDGLPSEAGEVPPGALEPEKADTAGPTVSGPVRWPVADGGDLEAEEDELPPLSISSRRKSARLFPVLLGTLAALVLGAAGYYLIQGGGSGPRGMLPDQVKRLMGTGEESPVVAVRSLEGEFISNREAGELFVMRGEIFNSSGKPVTSLRVKGTVYGTHGEALAQRTVFCGNTLSREQLVFQPYSSMEKLMGRQFGDTLANLEVSPGKAVPFLIVFRDLPKGATDFGAAVFGAADR